MRCKFIWLNGFGDWVRCELQGVAGRNGSHKDGKHIYKYSHDPKYRHSFVKVGAEREVRFMRAED